MALLTESDPAALFVRARLHEPTEAGFEKKKMSCNQSRAQQERGQFGQKHRVEVCHAGAGLPVCCQWQRVVAVACLCVSGARWKPHQTKTRVSVSPVLAKSKS